MPVYFKVESLLESYIGLSGALYSGRVPHHGLLADLSPPLVPLHVVLEPQTQTLFPGEASALKPL